MLIDIQMPVIGGLKATAKIRQYKQLSGARRLPIITLIAYTIIGDHKRYI